MKIKYLLLLSILFSFTMSFGQEGYKEQIAHLASITFPQKPTIKDTLGQQVLHYADTNSGAHYLVIVQNLSKESGFQLKANDLDDFYEGNIEGFLKASNGKVVSKKPFVIHGLKGLDVIYTSISNPNLPDHRFKRILFVNDVLLSIDFWTFSDKEAVTKASKDIFLNSLTLTADLATLTQVSLGDGENKAHAIGYFTGSILGKLVIFAIITTIIFLIIRITRKKKSSNEQKDR